MITVYCDVCGVELVAGRNTLCSKAIKDTFVFSSGSHTFEVEITLGGKYERGDICISCGKKFFSDIVWVS